MIELTFVTGNAEKYRIALELFEAAGLPLRQAVLDVDEIQSEDVSQIATTKAKAAFEQLRLPLIMRDDSWSIPGLNGFPGPYMKSLNHWFTTEDFLHLTRPLTDRRAFLIQTLVYIDGATMHVMQHETSATLLTEATGSSMAPFENIASIEGDGGKSIAEVMASGQSNINRKPAEVWHEFIAWYKKYSGDS